MNWTLSSVELPAPSASGPAERPAEYLNALPSETWRAVTGPVRVDSPASEVPWLTACVGEMVRVPLVPYRVARNPALAMAFAVQLGFAVGQKADRARRVHLVLASQLEDLAASGQDSARFWIGIAVEG